MTEIEQLITDNIGAWTTATKPKASAGKGSGTSIDLYGIRSLRGLILDLGVRGLLVPQDDTEEGIEKFLQARAATVQSGSRAASKKVDTDETLIREMNLRELPNGWEWCRLRDICDYIQRGKSPKYAEAGKVRVVSQKCVQSAGFDEAPARFITDASLEKYTEERFLRNNDLLWNSTGTGTVGRVVRLNGIEDGKFVADSHVTVVRTSLPDAVYLTYYISSSAIQGRMDPSHIDPLVSGSTNQVELNKSVVESFLVPLPPLSEQKRIIDRVDELMLLCDQLEAQQADSIEAHKRLVTTLLDALTKATEQEGFDSAWTRVADHFDVLFTTEWSVDQLSKAILRLAVVGKLTRQSLKEESAEEYLRRIREYKKQLVDSGAVRKSTATPADDSGADLPKLPMGWIWVRFGELLINRDSERVPLSVDERKTRGGVYDYYGASGVIDSIDDFLFDKPLLLIGEDGANLINRSTPIAFVARGRYWVNNHAHVLDGISEDLLLFVCLYINAINLEPYVTGTAQPKMNQAKMNSILIALPPEQEQRRLVAKVDELMAVCDALKSGIQEAQQTQLLLADAITKRAVA